MERVPILTQMNVEVCISWCPLRPRRPRSRVEVWWGTMCLATVFSSWRTEACPWRNRHLSPRCWWKQSTVTCGSDRTVSATFIPQFQLLPELGVSSFKKVGRKKSRSTKKRRTDSAVISQNVQIKRGLSYQLDDSVTVCVIIDHWIIPIITDYSQPHLLGRKLVAMNAPATMICWILDYLTSCLQIMRLGEPISDLTPSNTGCHQGTVLAPFLIILYTAEYQPLASSNQASKFAGDTAMTGLIYTDEDTAYSEEILSFTEYCEQNFLHLNVSKTREMILDFRQNTVPPPPIFITGAQVERVTKYK